MEIKQPGFKILLKFLKKFKVETKYSPFTFLWLVLINMHSPKVFPFQAKWLNFDNWDKAFNQTALIA